MRDVARVVVLSEETAVSAAVRQALGERDYVVRDAVRPDDAIEAARSQSTDLVVVDVLVGTERGNRLVTDLVRQLDVPIFIVSPLGDVFDRILGLELGADDYLVRPFHPRELSVRVKTLLRRTRRRPEGERENIETGEEVYRSGEIELNHTRREVKRAGAPLNLTAMEYNLFLLLLRRPRRVLSRNDIMDELKGNDWTPNDRSIDVLVAKLRRKIGVVGAPSVIRTVRGSGYIYSADVQRT